MKKLLVHILVILFGAGSWIAINGVWVELPIIVYQCPEQWKLTAYLAIITQVANIGPVMVTLFQIWNEERYNKNLVIYILLGLGMVSTFLLPFSYNQTININGKEISLGLFLLYFAIACVDCTSSVTFLPFMNELHNEFITTYFVGEGLSGVLPSAMALLQGVGYNHCMNESVFNNISNTTSYQVITTYENPRFSERIFFMSLFVMMSLSGISFILLNHWSWAKCYHISMQSKAKSHIENKGIKIENAKEELISLNQGDTSKMSLHQCVQQDVSEAKELKKRNNRSAENITTTSTSLTKRNYVYLLLTILWINIITNGVYPSIASYISLPYSQASYHFAATLGNLANPLACSVAVFLSMHNMIGITCLTLAGTGVGAYIFIIALQSPCPPLIHLSIGSTIMVIAVVLFVGVLSYVKVTIGQIFRQQGNKQSLLIYGAVVQIGSFIGALTMFLIVTYTNTFTPGDPCQSSC